MATREEWTRLINLSHDLALVEDDLRTVALEDDAYRGDIVATRILFERFGVRV